MNRLEAFALAATAAAAVAVASGTHFARRQWKGEKMMR